MQSCRIASLVFALMLPLACKSTPEAPPPAPDIQAAPAGTRPAPFESPEAAFRALFDALRTHDLARVEATFLSDAECAVATGDANRCAELQRRRHDFLAAVTARPLPEDARIAGITLLESLSLPKGERGLMRDVRIQPGSIRFTVQDRAVALDSIAAIAVEGGWRVLPGQKKADAPAALAPDAGATPPAP